MSRFGAPSGMNSTIDGGPFSGMNANEWAHYHFLPGAVPHIVGISVAVVIGIWEYCAFFPAEVVLWQRVSKRGRPSRSSFAPWTTLILRYLMLCFAVSTAFTNWSTDMNTNAACQAAGGFTFASWCALVVVCAFAIAWRAQAVARGIIQSRAAVRIMQILIAVLVLMQIFITIFTSVWLGVRQHTFWAVSVYGQCNVKPPPSFGPVDDFGPPPYQSNRPRRQYYEDPLLWYWVFMILFNLLCLAIVLVALHTLANRSRGFSKLIAGMRNHSVFYFVLVGALSILGIVWRKVQNASWVMYPTTVIQAAVMIRILLAEQNAARRPMDTTYMDHHGPPSRHHLSTRGHGLHAAGHGNEAVAAAVSTAYMMRGPNDPAIQFADQAHRSEGNGNLQPLSSAMAMRPIYQPFSMMDNLGQAFSQVDSRNSNDMDGQSVEGSLSRQSLDLPANIYPGVFAMEERERRAAEMEKHLAAKLNDSNEEGDLESSAKAIETEEEKSKVSSTKDQPAAPAVRHPLRRFATSRSTSNDDDDDGEDDDDDGEIGIQTSNF